MIFLIEYDRASGTLVLMQPFAETDAVNAQRARIALELNRMQFRMDREIVILDAASETDVRKTHRRYFEPIESLANPDLVTALRPA